MIYLGISSWTNLGEKGEFYPIHILKPRGRLSYYAQKFSTVEIDSSCYGLLDRNMTRLWSYRAGSGFLFHVRAHNAFTGHPLNVARLINDKIKLKFDFASNTKPYVYIKDPEDLKTIADKFILSIDVLMKLKKIGNIVFSFPHWFRVNQQSVDHLKMIRELFYDLPIAFEFGNGTWFNRKNSNKLFEFLGKNSITYITSDQPQFGDGSTAPFIPHITTDTAYFRINGRSPKWFDKTIHPSLRYEYLYDRSELQKMIPDILHLSSQARDTFVIFNNLKYGHAVTNCQMLQELIRDELSVDGGE